MGVINLGWLITKLKNRGFLTSSDASAAGFIKNTDYATGTTGGVVKVANSSGMSITTQGTLQAAVRTEQQYNDAAGTLVMGKGTLDNIKSPLVISALASLADADGTAATGTKWDTLVLEKTADGYTLSFKNTTTP